MAIISSKSGTNSEIFAKDLLNFYKFWHYSHTLQFNVAPIKRDHS